jgi:hypothetical protein
MPGYKWIGTPCKTALLEIDIGAADFREFHFQQG